MELFYADKISIDQALFDVDESRHITKTYRKRLGDPVHFTQGEGFLYHGTIEKIDKKGVAVKILDKLPQQKVWHGRLHLAVAPTKNFNRIEWMIERMVELGIDEITPILTERSERRTWKASRLERLIKAAAKQSLKCQLPILNDPIAFDTFCNQLDSDQHLYFGHCEKGEKIGLADIDLKSKNVCFAVGPEGDFSPQEIEMASEHHFTAISLGQQRLRTETAAMKMGVAFHIYNDWE